MNGDYPLKSKVEIIIRNDGRLDVTRYTWEGPYTWKQTNHLEDLSYDDALAYARLWSC